MRSWGVSWLGQYERGLLWLVVFGVGYGLLGQLPPILRALLSLTGANVAYLLLAWQACMRLKADRLRRWATRPAPPLLVRHPWVDFWLLGGRTGLAFVLSASVVGFVAAALFLPAVGRLGLARGQVVLASALCVLSVLLSWLMAHLAYTLHYAYLYYSRPRPGLAFPEDDAPDLMDFAYFAFTVGATFATSDVNVTGKEMRRTVLGHTLFSFAFNTSILAMALQALTGG